jgi:hypothetical protein
MANSPGGDRLAMWSHPGEVAVGFVDGTGWPADAIASAWPSTFAPAQQSVGQKLLPEPPR